MQQLPQGERARIALGEEQDGDAGAPTAVSHHVIMPLTARTRPCTIIPMDSSSPPRHADDLATVIEEYRITANLGMLIDRVRAIATAFSPEELARATAPFRDMPEVVIPA